MAKIVRILINIKEIGRNNIFLSIVNISFNGYSMIFATFAIISFKNEIIRTLTLIKNLLIVNMYNSIPIRIPKKM